MPEKEIVIDLSKKIKFTSKVYISIGSLLFSTIILIIQLLMCLSGAGWQWTDACWYLLLNYAYSVRVGQKEEKEEDDNG